MRHLVLALLLASGCVTAAGQEVLDLGAPQPYGVCRGPADRGKTVWWRGWGDYVPWSDPLGVRYECKDHGSGRDGWWFEAHPERREVP